MKYLRPEAGRKGEPARMDATRHKGASGYGLHQLAIALPPTVFIVSNAVFLALLRFAHMDTVIRITYNTNTLYTPLLLAGAALVLFLAPPGRPRIATVWLMVALLLISLRIYGTHLEPHRLQVRELTIHTPKVQRPLTVLHMSDIQSAGVGRYEEKVFARIRALNPDLLLYTGDFLQPVGKATFESELPKLAALFATLAPPLGMYAVEGESDHALKSHDAAALGGIRFLHTEAVVIEWDGAPIRILGLQLSDTRTRGVVPLETIDRWLAESPDDALNIVMGHRPDYMMRLHERTVDLCLAGHTHGGQIRLPFYGPLITSSGVPRDWARGFRTEGQARFNVSAGIGSGHNKGLPAIRFNCPPEMTVIHILPEVPPVH